MADETPELSPTLAMQVGKRVARKVFEGRGNRSEAHLKETELAAIIEAACSLYYSCLPKEVNRGR